MVRLRRYSPGSLSSVRTVRRQISCLTGPGLLRWGAHPASQLVRPKSGQSVLPRHRRKRMYSDGSVSSSSIKIGLPSCVWHKINAGVSEPIGPPGTAASARRATASLFGRGFARRDLFLEEQTCGLHFLVADKHRALDDRVAELRAQEDQRGLAVLLDRLEVRLNHDGLATAGEASRMLTREHPLVLVMQRERRRVYRAGTD